MSGDKWSCPGGYSWNAVVSQIQMYASLCLRAKQMDLTEWNAGTFKEVMKWSDFVENVHDELSAHDKIQLNSYLTDPSSFASTGETDCSIVLISGVTVKTLGRAGHFTLRKFLSNPSLRRSHVIIKAVVISYLKMIDCPEDKPEVIEVLTKDLTREVLPNLESSFCFEWLCLHGNNMADRLNLSVADVFDEEIRYFLRTPAKIKLFGLSRCLRKKMSSISPPALNALCEKLVKKCRKNTTLLEVVALCLVERGMFMRSKKVINDKDEEVLSTHIENVIVEQLMMHQSWLDLWNTLDIYVAVQIAAKNKTLERAFLKAQNLV